jgi:ABC-type lipoprotein release transport system permease subunit
VIFLIVYVVALLTTFAPAMRASRVRPAEALRYQ